MRLRVLMPKAIQFRADWLSRWISRLRSRREAPSLLDRRWCRYREGDFLPCGRLFLRRNRDWECEYLFDVLKDGEVNEVRVVLPERLVEKWQSRLGKRVTEAMRLELVSQELRRVTPLKQLPSRKVIEDQVVEAILARDGVKPA